MTTYPQISVITATRNNGPYLSEAIESILNQTFTDFEYIIIDDASTDESQEIILGYATSDARIVTRRNDRMEGRSASRNRGLALARAPWIAVFDGDDISHLERFERQVNFLRYHPNIDYIGTGCHHINKQTGEYMPDRIFRPAPSHGQISWELCFTFPFHHSSTMGKKDAFVQAGGWPIAYPVCEDISLWMTMTNKGCRFGNLEDKLLTYRVNTELNYYSLNEVVAQQLHRQHIGTIRHSNVPNDVFSILWQTNRADTYGMEKVSDMGLFRAITVLLELYDHFQAQRVFSSEDVPIVRTDLIERIRGVMRLRLYDTCPQLPKQHTYQYTYQLRRLPDTAGAE